MRNVRSVCVPEVALQGRATSLNRHRAEAVSRRIRVLTIAGWIAGKIVKGSGSGILVNIVVGVIGALIGGFLLSFFLDTAGGGWWFTLFTAILGSVILLWIVGMVQGRRT